MARSAKMTVQDWRAGYGVVNPTDKEVITYALWDRKLYTSGTTTQINFFDVQTDGIAGNLPLAGQLPNGWAFLIQALRFVPALPPFQNADADPNPAAVLTGPLNDMFNLISTGHIRIRIGDKEYGRWPLFMTPGGGGVVGNLGLAGTLTADAAAAATQANNGNPDPRAVYSFPIPIVIPPQYNFRVIAEWPAAVTLAVGDSQIFCVLDGEVMRPQQ